MDAENCRHAARRIRRVQTPVIPIVGRWTADNPGTISLGQGVVHFPPPSEVFRSVADASLGDRSLDRYGPFAGRDSLIQLLIEKLRHEDGIDVASTDCSVVCTAGANMGFLSAVLAIADLGDEIILLSPYYFNHHMAIEIAGCRVITVATDSQNQPDLDAISAAITDRTKAIVTVSPNNPTGAVYPEATLRQINRLAGERGIYHLSDEAYEYFYYDDMKPFSAASTPGASAHTISLYSLSKSYAMAGWRIGYAVIPNHLLDAFRKIQDTNLICPPVVCQVAAEAALRVGSHWCLRRVPELQSVRDSVIETLASLGDRCEIAKPNGAFYVFLKLHTDRRDMDLVESLIREHAVAVLPGSAFGATDGCSLRLSFGALDSHSVREGVGRLRDGLHRLL